MAHNHRVRRGDGAGRILCKGAGHVSRQLAVGEERFIRADIRFGHGPRGIGVRRDSCALTEGCRDRIARSHGVEWTERCKGNAQPARLAALSTDSAASSLAVRVRRQEPAKSRGDGAGRTLP